MHSWVLLVVTALALSVYLASKSNALFISWSEKVKLTDDNIFIPMKNIIVPGRRFNQHFENLTESMSFDERCQGGYPLTMAWSPNEPYSGINGPRTVNGTKGIIAFGIFPGVINQIVKHCCPGSQFLYARLMRSVRQADSHLSKNKYDFTYPVYVQRWKSKTYKDQPFVPVVQAPRVMLIVYDDVKVSKTSLLVETIFSAWPFLLFILALALLAGLVIWMLFQSDCYSTLVGITSQEKIAHSQEFTVQFVQGTWDGFWWAVVTMTTVGYGDKAPKTIPGRLFCLIWIIVGINIVASFTALITATVTASTQPYFNVNGAKVGAVNGSEEFRLGVTLNADMRGFTMPSAMTKALKAHEIDGMLIDNYALTRFSQFFDTEKTIRLESTMDHSITYGMVLPSGNTKTETCVRRYMKNYRQEVFGSISKQLKPLSQLSVYSAVSFRAAKSIQRPPTVSLQKQGLYSAASVYSAATFCSSGHPLLSGRQLWRWWLHYRWMSVGDWFVMGIWIQAAKN
ncbi:hypothetical protein QZH41_020338, partial [Actinostola sp. cb2023]